MIFSSPEFLLFFGFCFFVYWGIFHFFSKSQALVLRKLFLLVVSYYFYMSWNTKFIFLILISTLIDYYAAIMIDQSEGVRKRRFFLLMSLVANLGLLGFFKYFNFFLSNINEISSLLGIKNSLYLEILLPVGISFYTFQSMSYTIDVYYKKLKPVKNFIDFALFISFFPQLVAGPIVRARDFLYQLDFSKKITEVDFRFAIYLFTLGLIKKTIISDYVSSISDDVFLHYGDYSFTGLWVGLVSYAIQIYCDFSGYSDMAIGVSACFGYRLTENFNMPYIALTITDFWRRWHISLSTWLRDYLYIPLGGNKGGELKTYRNLIIVMLLGGLWHGASWNFVIWGAIHGFFLAIHKLIKDKLRFEFKWDFFIKIPFRFVGYLMTLFIVLYAWVFFRAPNLTVAFEFQQRLLDINSSGKKMIPASFCLMLIFLIVGHTLGLLWQKYEGGKFYEKIKNHSWPFEAIIYGAVFTMIYLFSSNEIKPFIYFQF